MLNIKINKSDVKNYVILNSYVTEAFINAFNINEYPFTSIQINKSHFFKPELLKKYKYKVTIDTGNVTGILIFTILNGQRTIIYYNYSVFTILNNLLEVNVLLDDQSPQSPQSSELFNNHIFSVQKLQSMTGEKENIYFLIYNSLTGYLLENICYNSSIFTKVYCSFNNIKAIVEDYVPSLPFKVSSLLFVPQAHTNTKNTNQYNQYNQCMQFHI